ncbi:MAG: TatD family hydrolase [Alphaproteobacteria bacterium]
MLVDSHCHLDFPDLAEDRAGILARAATAGIGTMVTISTHVTRADQVRAVAEAHDPVYCTMGIHPHHVAEEPAVSVADLAALTAHPKVIGLGESGLDYYYERSPRDIQQDRFRTHIAAARETGLPLVVHTRDADDDTAAMLEEEMAKGAFPGLLHCFSSGAELARRAVEIGFYVSFSGILTFNRAADLRAIAAELPADRLLVETDAPYLAPVPYRGKRNEPAFVAHTAAVLAETRGVSADEIAHQTTENFFRLFTKAQRPSAAAA